LDAPKDGLGPATFFTYHIVFVPDLTQKYGLKIRGGTGEIRAAMNLVNGWQFTGIGPFYMKDSSTAQNILAAGISTRLGGQAVADVLKSAADLGQLQNATVDAGHPAIQSLSRTLEALPANCRPMTLTKYAEIVVYEPSLNEQGQMIWNEIVNLCFDRDYLGMERVEANFAPASASAASAAAGTLNSAVVNGTDASIARTAVAGVFGITPDSGALRPLGRLESGETGGVAATPSNAMQQVQVDCGDGCGTKSKQFNLININKHGHSAPRGRIETRSVSGLGALNAAAGNGVAPSGAASAVGGGLQSGGVNNGAAVTGRSSIEFRSVIDHGRESPPQSLPSSGSPAAQPMQNPLPTPPPTPGPEVIPPANGTGGNLDP